MYCFETQDVKESDLPKRTRLYKSGLQKTPKSVENSKEYNIPGELMDYLKNNAGIIKTITGDDYSGPKYLEFYRPEELRIIEIKFAVTTEHIRNTEENVKNDPHYRDSEVDNSNQSRDQGEDCGKYFGKAVDLIKRASDYFPDGMLVWLPELNIFGVYDCEHENVQVFPHADTKDVSGNIGLFINSQWCGCKIDYPDYPVEFGNIFDYYQPSKFYEYRILNQNAG